MKAKLEFPLVLTRELYLAGGFFPVSCSLYLYRREALARAGPYDETLAAAPDCDFHFRLLGLTEIPVLAVRTFERRLHSANLSLAGARPRELPPPRRSRGDPAGEPPPRDESGGDRAVGARIFMNHASRVVLVTGAGRGIGAACAEKFLDEGDVVVLVSRTQGTLERTARRLAAGGRARRILALAGDVSDEAFVRSAFAGARRRLRPRRGADQQRGGVLRRPFAGFSSATGTRRWRRTCAGPFLCSREFLPAVPPARAGPPPRDRQPELARRSLRHGRSFRPGGLRRQQVRDRRPDRGARRRGPAAGHRRDRGRARRGRHRHAAPRGAAPEARRGPRRPRARDRGLASPSSSALLSGAVVPLDTNL